jgi:hypothetical protein
MLIAAPGSVSLALNLCGARQRTAVHNYAGWYYSSGLLHWADRERTTDFVISHAATSRSRYAPGSDQGERLDDYKTGTVVLVGRLVGSNLVLPDHWQSGDLLLPARLPAVLRGHRLKVDTDAGHSDLGILRAREPIATEIARGPAFVPAGGPPSKTGSVKRLSRRRRAFRFLAGRRHG